MANSPFCDRLLPLVLLLSLITGSAAASARCHPDDESALLAFKNAVTADPTGLLATWKRGADCCAAWSGIKCGANSRVTHLSLSGDNTDPNSLLAGAVPLSVSKLQELTSLHLDNLKNLTGPFPGALLLLPNLADISITDAQLSCDLPADLGRRLPKLATLRLSSNQLSGRPFPSVAGLSQLTQLDLSRNSFVGEIPASVRSLRNLATLALDSNMFLGPIPDLSSMASLRVLSLSSNRFSGSIPMLPAKLTRLVMTDNAMSGSIPLHLGRLTELETLDLSVNFLSGSIPPSLFRNLVRVTDLNLSRNFLQGPVPPIASTAKISSLDLSANNNIINGSIPRWVEALPSLCRLGLSSSGITMRLEDFNPVALSSSYEYLDLSANKITGSAAPLVARAGKLVGLNLSANKLRFDMGKLKLPATLKSLEISDNSVYGSLPPEISRLEELDVSFNRLCGPIPPNDFPATAFRNNDCLCGSPLPTCRRGL